MVLAPWHSSLARALHRNRSQPHSRYLQLATTRVDGKPANRTVVFRGFAEQTDQLQFVTDTRSSKIGQIQDNPWAEACWYFIKTREQFRLLGTLTIISEETQNVVALNLRQSIWRNLSDAAKEQFSWAYPGKPTSLESKRNYSTLDGNPLPNFAVLLLNVAEVDHLELRGEPQRRSRYWQNKESLWLSESINP